MTSGESALLVVRPDKFPKLKVRRPCLGMFVTRHEDHWLPGAWLQRSKVTRSATGMSNVFANETERDQGKRHARSATLIEVTARSARHAGTPETGKSLAVHLITQPWLCGQSRDVCAHVTVCVSLDRCLAWIHQRIRRAFCDTNMKGASELG